MRSNKEIVKSMNEAIQYAYYRFYSMQRRMENATNEVDREKYASRLEKRSSYADDIVRSYSQLLNNLGINEKIDTCKLMELALDEVRELERV